MFCKNCGKKILDDSKFCPTCGFNIVTTQEKKITLKGISGWLILPGLGLLFSIIYYLYTFFTNTLPLIIDGETWASLATVGSSIYSPLWQPAIIFESIFTLLLFAAATSLFILYLKKNKHFPRYYIAWLIASLIFTCIDYFLIEELLNQTPVVKEYISPDDSGFGQAIIAAIIWIPYIIKSKRVKNTFVEENETAGAKDTIFSKKKLAILLPIISIILIPIISLTIWLVTKEKSNLNFNNTKAQLIRESVSAAVVNIICPFAEEGMNLDSDGYGGSGTMLTKEGLVITNSHIIPQDVDYINTPEEGCFVMLPDPTSGELLEIYLAQPVVIPGISEEYDIAYLEIYDAYKDEAGKKYGEFPREFPIYNQDLCEAATEYVQLGEKIRIYGYPSSSGGMSLTITEGIVSSFPEEGLIYTSAKIDAGNSGGLAVDEIGCMIGIPSAVNFGEYDNLGVIISSNLIDEFNSKAEELEATDNTIPYPEYLIKYNTNTYDKNVEKIQSKLNLSYNYNVTVDGFFGQETLDAVLNFQTKNTLPPNGIIDQETWDKIFSN